jgi:hypothetical protein
MEIKNTFRATPGKIRTVHPLGDADPDFFVEIEEISDTEANKILDRHGYMPGTRGATMTKLEKVTRDNIRRRVRNFGGLTENGAELDATDANKLRFLEIITEVDGEEKNLWTLTVEAEQNAKEDERKNS